MALGRVATAQTFSADIVTTTASGANVRRGRVYVSHTMVRIETPEIPTGFFLVDSERNAAWFVRPEQRLFMDARLSSPLTQSLVVVDPENPCPQWQTREANASPVPIRRDQWKCEPVAKDALEGRETLRYRVRSLQNRDSDRWVDVALRFPLRIESADGVVVVEHVVDAPQPSELFSIPPAFHKFDPVELLHRMEHSDVLVAPPGQ